ncbi:abortive infection family protein [Sphingomonas trueperi]|uniref:abortive infection family protein n=1 Tax=Sphingomonas trueperi TaxID=53317 RepID=UPI001C7CF59C
MSSIRVHDLRTRIAEVVGGNKAYDVPAVCIRLGLAEGTDDEAMRGKFRYVHSRLVPLSTVRVVAVARELLEQDWDFWLAELVAKVTEHGTPQVSTLTRRRIFDVFDGQPLCTEYDQLAFLEDVFPIGTMPSAFPDVDVWGHRSLKDDIIQHTIRNDDWSNRELFERLGLLDASKALLFRFLEAAVHPTAIEEACQKQRVESINRHLQHDGYCLSRTGRMSGSPVYTVYAAAIGSPADAAISDTLARFEPDQVHARWTAALDRRSDDPAGAITLARTLLEDVCRWLLHDLNIVASEKDDLPALYRMLSKALKLAPDDHSEQVFKQILGNCQSIVESLGALRNKLGDAHGGGPKRARPAARHAELAVNLAGSMATFLVSTWQTRRTSTVATPTPA